MCYPDFELKLTLILLQILYRLQYWRSMIGSIAKVVIKDFLELCYPNDPAGIADFVTWATTYTTGTNSTAPFLWYEYDDEMDPPVCVSVLYVFDF
jgi:hypothetical protein